MARRFKSVFLFAGFVLLCVVPGHRGASTPVENTSPDIPTDTVITEGKLPNGLRYVILPHVSPKNDLSLRLLVHAGSLDERDDERGFAHFVEHMAFRGTRSYPAGGIRQAFEKLGVAFGADLNARTHSTHTSYLLDLPEGKATDLPEALHLLREFADGISFAPDQVAREAGVVLSELRVRDNPNQRIARQTEEILYAPTRIAARSVIGVPEQIKRASADQLRAYYNRNYSPERMTVLVVGPVEPAAVAAMINAAFASLTPSPNAVPPTAVPAPVVLNEIAPHILLTPRSPGVTVEVIRIRSRPPDDEAGRRQEHLRRISLRALAARLRARQELMAPALGSSKAEETTGACPELLHDTVGATAIFPRWGEVVGFLETELRRIRLQGLTQAEVDEAVAVSAAEQRAALPLFVGAPAASVAEEIENAVQAGRQWRSPAAEFADFTQASNGLTVKSATEALLDAFPEKKFHLVLLTPSPIPGGEAAVVGAFIASASRPLSPQALNGAELTFEYADFGPPGTIFARSQDPDLAIERITFKNGVQLNLRASNLEPERFRLRVSFAQNASDVPRDRPGMAELAGMVYLGAHLGRHLDTQVVRLLALHGVTRQMEVSRGMLTITYSGQSSELPFTLALVTAYASDLRLDRVVYPVAFSRYNHNFTAQLNDLPHESMAEALYRAGNRDPRLRLARPSQVSRYKFDDVQRWINTYWVNGPIEIGIVGEFAPAKIVAAAAATVGTLAPRIIPPPAKPLVTSRRGSMTDLTGGTVAGAASTALFWPLARPDEPRANAAATVALTILTDRLRSTLRDDLGATYTPSSGLRRDRRQPDFGFAWVAIPFAPERAAEFTDRSLTIAERFAKKGATLEEFERLREPIRSRFLSDLRNNSWWLDAVVALAQSQPSGLSEARVHARIVDELTFDDVNQAARIFGSASTVTIVRPVASP